MYNINYPQKESNKWYSELKEWSEYTLRTNSSVTQHAIKVTAKSVERNGGVQFELVVECRKRNTARITTVTFTLVKEDIQEDSQEENMQKEDKIE